MVTRFEDLDLNKTYSYADYLLWKFEERVELYKGKIFKMSPAPNTIHQVISRELTGVFYTFFKMNKCEYFVAPFDVRLPKQKIEADDKIYNVLQPDLCVICDNSKIDEKGCIGAPDLIVEILSPGNTKREMKYKYELYEEAGVKEYWIIDAAERTLFIFVLQIDKFIGLAPIIEEDEVHSTVFPDLKFRLKDLYLQ